MNIGEHHVSDRTRNIRLMLSATLTSASTRIFLIVSMVDYSRSLALSLAKENSLGIREPRPFSLLLFNPLNHLLELPAQVRVHT